MDTNNTSINSNEATDVENEISKEYKTLKNESDSKIIKK